MALINPPPKLIFQIDGKDCEPKYDATLTYTYRLPHTHSLTVDGITTEGIALFHSERGGIPVYNLVTDKLPPFYRRD